MRSESSPHLWFTLRERYVEGKEISRECRWKLKKRILFTLFVWAFENEFAFAELIRRPNECPPAHQPSSTTWKSIEQFLLCFPSSRNYFEKDDTLPRVGLTPAFSQAAASRIDLPNLIRKSLNQSNNQSINKETDKINYWNALTARCSQSLGVLITFIEIGSQSIKFLLPANLTLSQSNKQANRKED